jgi:hypothetical protein
MKFTLNPLPGEAGFAQWKDAMRALAKFAGGIPQQFRKNLWLNLSHHYIKSAVGGEWPRVLRVVFNERSNPDDDELGVQIVKDLHRTGCSAFSGQENEQDRAQLKRVLLAYARYNKSIGYCQGFNIIVALILEVVERKEEDALACMIYLIDHVLPQGYFTNSMHTLAIDMAVFRELLKCKLPKLYEHLHKLQQGSNDASQHNPPSSTYEPPLTNVFTMQWFLTLFATCLPKHVLVRVWDCIFLEGSEILFRTSIAIWDKLSVSIMKAESADSFYSMMSLLTVRLFDENVINGNDLVARVYSYGSFPLVGLAELREKFTFNITPFKIVVKAVANDDANKRKINKSSSGRVGSAGQLSELEFGKRREISENEQEQDAEIEDLAKMMSCFALLMPSNRLNHMINDITISSSNERGTNKYTIRSLKDSPSSVLNMSGRSANEFSNRAEEAALRNSDSRLHRSIASASAATNYDISTMTPGAFSYTKQMYDPKPLEEQLTLDLAELRKQYKKLKERQQQAQVIIQTALLSSQAQKGMILDSEQDESTKPHLSSSSSSTSQKEKNQIYDRSEAHASPANLTPHIHGAQLTGHLAPFPVLNHLMMKTNDLKYNMIKKCVRLSATGMVEENEASEDERRLTARLHKKINESVRSLDENSSIKNKKAPKPYYSDEDESEDDDEDEDEIKLNDKARQTNEVYENESLISVGDEADANNLTLIELAKSESMPTHKEQESVSNESVVAPIISERKKSLSLSISDTLRSESTSSSTANKAQTSRRHSPKPKENFKLINSAVIINNLINEELKHATPTNPFPIKSSVNSNVAKNGIRLGLYK